MPHSFSLPIYMAQHTAWVGIGHDECWVWMEWLIIQIKFSARVLAIVRYYLIGIKPGVGRRIRDIVSTVQACGSIGKVFTFIRINSRRHVAFFIFFYAVMRMPESKTMPHFVRNNVRTRGYAIDSTGNTIKYPFHQQCLARNPCGYSHIIRVVSAYENTDPVGVRYILLQNAVGTRVIYRRWGKSVSVQNPMANITKKNITLTDK